MRIVTEESEKRMYADFVRRLLEDAGKSNCERTQRVASVFIYNEKKGEESAVEEIARGYNYTENLEPCRICMEDFRNGKKASASCDAEHAESDAVKKAMLAGGIPAGAYLMHLKTRNGEAMPSGSLSCSYCSKNILHSPVEYVVMWHKKGTVIGRQSPVNGKQYRLDGREERLGPEGYILPEDAFVVYTAEEFHWQTRDNLARKVKNVKTT